MVRNEKVVWISIACAGAACVLLVWLGIRHWRPRWTIIEGAAIRRDSDTHKESPIAGVSITATHGDLTIATESDASGYFKIAFPGTVLPGQIVKLTFRHADYKELDRFVTIQLRSSLRQLVVASLQPVSSSTSQDLEKSSSTISNIRVRYTVNSQNDENVGNAVRTFQVVNKGNVPCHRQYPCSPDGFWRAASATVQLDAGVGNEFRSARASCIAGPCPFTRIDPSGFVSGGRTISATATDWSDTTTFLLEAEVFHSAIVSNVRETYPVVFGRAISFTLPPSAEGVSLEAEVNGTQMVFPLGPELFLSWATCAVRPGSKTENSTVYQCELKTGYRF